MGELDDRHVFLAVAAAGGFRAAAGRLGATTAGVSKSVRRLEKRLGARLFERTTRRVALTAEGAALRERLAPLMRALELAEDEVSEHAGASGGLVRLSAPITYGIVKVVPVVAALRERHPEIAIELVLDDDVVNLLAEGIDVAIRVGDLAEAGLKARKLGTTRWCALASPAYLAAHGTPQTVEDLDRHTCVAYHRRGTRTPWPWRFRINGAVRKWQPPAGLAINDGHANQALVHAAVGIVFDLSFPYAAALASGALVEVLPGHSVEGPPVHVLWPDGPHLPQRTRIVIDALAQGAVP